MGNCLVHNPKTIQIIKPDGKILEYRNPVKVHQVLSDFSGHGIMETPPLSMTETRYLSSETALQRGLSYYLVPVKDVSVKKKTKKKVRFADVSDSGDGVVGSGSTAAMNPVDGVVRIKVVISKRELMEMMGNGGVTVGEELMCRITSGQGSLPGQQLEKVDVGGEGWKPRLEIIHEINDHDQLINSS